MSGLKQTIYRHILKRIRNRQFNVKLQEVTLLFRLWHCKGKYLFKNQMFPWQFMNGRLVISVMWIVEIYAAK